MPDVTLQASRIRRQSAVRRQRVRWVLAALSQQVLDWQTHRQAADVDHSSQYVGRHKTQLQAVASLIQGSLEVLQQSLDRIELDAPPDEVFAHSRRVAQAVVWLERLWQYFKERFDQRDRQGADDLRATDRRAELVRAADEVVWSCYRPTYEHVRIVALELPPHPPPLPYVEAQYAPAARMCGDALGRQLQPTAGVVGLDEVASKLPIPLVILPPWCVGAPWWLVFIAHEVGHQLQHELGLVGPFRLAVQDVAQQAGADEGAVIAWGRYGQELFADLCSVLLMGPWALWALVEVEFDSDQKMRQPRSRYPVAKVRLHWMQRLLQHLGLEVSEALRGLIDEVPPTSTNDATTGSGEVPPTSPEPPTEPPLDALALDLAIADRLVDLLDHSWPKVGKLAPLLRFDLQDFAAGGVVQRWTNRLLSKDDLQPQRHVDTARQILAGSVAAWAHLSAGDDDLPALKTRADLLAQRTVQAICDASPPGTRSGLVPDADDPDIGRMLGLHLLTMAESTEDTPDE